MEEHTDTVDCVIDNAEKDLLMRIEEQISTQVAKTESDEDSGDEDDPVMVTCGKLILSAPDKDEKDDKHGEIQILDHNLQSMEIEENKHFTLTSIEKVDEEDFEAIFEINSDMDEIGLSESDIKALEFMESKEYIVLPNNSERPAPDDFSTSVLKFQDAIENYTKSVFSGISDTMDGIEKAKTAKSQPSIEQFSETVNEVENKYEGRIPVVEEQFEEVKAYTCGESEVKETYVGLSPTVEEPFEEIQVSHFEETPIAGDSDKCEYQQTHAHEFEDHDLVVEETIKDSQNIIVPEEEDLNDKKINETETDHTEDIPDDNSIDKSNPCSEHIDQSESIIKTSDIPNLLELDNTIEDTTAIEQNSNELMPFLEEDSGTKNADVNDKVEINQNFDIIGEPDIEEGDPEIEEGAIKSDETTDIKQHEGVNVLEQLTNEASSKTEKDAEIANELDEEKNKEQMLIDINSDAVKDINLIQGSVGGQSEKSEGAEIEVKSVDEMNFKYDTTKDTAIQHSSIAIYDVEKDESNENLGFYQPISPSEEAEVNKYENVSHKGLQRNAESRKSKRKIRNPKPFSQDEDSKIGENSTRNMEDMQLLLNTILVIAFGIFLFLISGDASTYYQDNSSESITRIPTTVSTVIDGYVQLSSLSEVELRK